MLLFGEPARTKKLVAGRTDGAIGNDLISFSSSAECPAFASARHQFSSFFFSLYQHREGCCYHKLQFCP
jgi:hypothetical protein